MVLEVLALFPRLAPFKVITLDDGWDQWNRSFMFIMCVLFGSVITIRSYTGSVIECDGFIKVSGGVVHKEWGNICNRGSTQGCHTGRTGSVIVINLQ